MEFHVHTSAGSQHVMTVHRDENDDTPLQLISAQRLAGLEQLAAQQPTALAPSHVEARPR